MKKALKFKKDSTDKFDVVLKQKVDRYFNDHGGNRFSNGKVYTKTFIMLALYLIPWVLILGNAFEQSWQIIGLWTLMGIGMAGGGLNIMHDAGHGAYSRNSKVNRALARLSNLYGVGHINWHIQHNVLHHTFTNIEGHDDSLHGGSLLRFSPHQPLRPWQRFQYVYAWPLYTLQTIVWALLTDFVRLRKYRDMDLLKPYKKTYFRLRNELILWKLSYFAAFLFLPIALSALPWWQTLLCFIGMQLSVGFFLTLVFITSHVMPECTYPLPDKTGSIEESWAAHQMRNCCNYATGSKWFSWYLGGLNFQTEHHLFPNICHVHYPALSEILKQTAAEFNLPYHHYKTFASAIRGHARMLKQLGNV